MLTRILIAGALSAAFASPVFAQADIICDQANMERLETDVSLLTDDARRAYAADQLAMAKQALAANDIDKCKTHMASALRGGSPD